MGRSNDITHPHLFMTMSLQYLTLQLDQLEVFGFPRAQALSLLNLTESDFSDPKARIDAAPVEDMFIAASKALSDPQLGIRVGYTFRVHDYGKTGSIYSYCETMKQVLELNQRYQCLAVDVGLPEYRIENGQHFFLFNRYQEAKDMHHVMGAIFGAWATALRWLSWATGQELKEAHLMPNAPPDISFYQEVLQCPIQFGQPRNHVEFFPEAMSKPLITRDAEKRAKTIAILDKLLNMGNEAENFKTILAASIGAAMAEGCVNLAVVSRRMDLDERALRKKLSDQGLSFRALVETERKALFQILHAKNETFAAIAQALAYNDQAAFNRAFKRWYGVPPSQYEASKT